MDKDKLLIKEILVGNSEGFREIVSRYQNKVFSVSLSMTNNYKDAEDLTQEVFIQVYKSLDTYQFKASFSTWIYRITINKALDWKKRKKNYDIQLIDEHLYNSDYPSNTTEELFLDNVERDSLRLQISKLPDIYKEVINLHYFDNYSYNQIAKKINISEKSVESRLYRARIMLKKMQKGSDSNEL